ncbi:hypothetical protein FFI94_032700 [Rhodococcus sp. KBS0724]|uniref:GAF domain-containing protein n=1 Tax=Rhodococcus sp. KBS0724 TaxID=1179674 RepID=UPI00110EF104|nr:GAF domain-containing protein [Rhodococcus sp. KBS0724]TSD40461.1 hypothetical protein FFI94_032700 [Rhodococcus sp. KBS0724]
MAAKWLLIEIFGDAAPSIIGVGSTPRRFMALDKVLKGNGSFDTALSAIAEVAASLKQIDRTSADSGRRIIVKPLVTFGGRLHGVYFWAGRPDEQVPEPDPAGAWTFNLTEGKASGSDDLLDLYGVPASERHTEKAMAGAFTRLRTNHDEGEALSKIIHSKPGTIHQAVWTVERDDKELRAAHFSCRMLQETDPKDGRAQVILRGITQDIGPAQSVVSAPPPVVLEYRVLEAATNEGEHRAIVNLKTLRLIRWIGEPVSGLAWESVDDQIEPGMHPEDLPIALAMSEGLARGKTHGTLRFRQLSGEWQSYDVDASLMALDQHTTAGLVMIRAAL